MKLVGVLHAEAILANGPSRRACARRTCPPAGFMRFRAVVAALVPVLLQGPLHAWPVDPVSAARIGRFKLAELAPDGRWDLTGTFEAVPAAAGGTLAYVFDLHPRGFVIVSGDNSLPPVIAYSLENALDAPGDHPNPLRALLRSDLENRLANGHKIPRAWRETNREAWDACLREDAQTDTQRDFRQWPPQGTTSTGGWLATRWTQDPPYNGFCPVDPTTGRRSLAGCPAVAMAQILHYHTSLNGTRFSDADDYFHNYAGQYMIDDDHELHGFPSFPELNVNLDTLTAHYEYGGPITNTDKAAVVFACGVAAHQVYSSQGSGTFGVDQAYQAYLRFAHDEVELLGEATPLLYPRLAVNMIDGLPAHLAVVTPQWNAGHNLVVDGYNTTGYFHMNFGWGGFPTRGMIFPRSCRTT
ncbi:MAG: C10 family peptidase [Candidatus Eisenbacteria bacterium]|nr:C10 family peptidase [Candidatus Eisenbacteria bacterium]